MTREDIIRMAREAGCIPRRHPEYDNDIQVFATPDVLERFAALVAAYEREACVRLVWDTPDPEDEYVSPRQAIADAIRARGNT